ncbi:MAG: hypothetical protein A4S09_17690 [Proteobacteria bacterium SG_bin7]|nr:MAG: hypothetical protein A4S09_17690 [Proteobacteria bacterium SG_bin7]
MAFTYEWDENKNTLNFEKHGVWFEEARTIWADPHAHEFFDVDHSSSDEDRFIRVGVSSQQKTLLVVFCEKNEGVIRIVSARRATAQEKKQYEEGI